MAYLGHVLTDAFSIIETLDLPRAVTKVFIRMSLSDVGKLNRMSNKAAE